MSVSGELTIKGKTQPATFKANQFTCYQNPMLKREVCGGDFETTIDRTAFGADYGVQYGFPQERAHRGAGRSRQAVIGG